MKKTLKLGRIEFYPENLGSHSFNRAVEMCQELGPGWRIPDLNEFRLLTSLCELDVGNVIQDKGSYREPEFWAEGDESAFFGEDSKWTWTPICKSNKPLKFWPSFDSSWEWNKHQVRPVRDLK